MAGEAPPKNFARDFFSKMVGFSIATWVSFGLSFLSGPISTWLFQAEEVGKINLFSNTYLTMFLSLAYLGLDQSYIRFYNEPPGKNTRKGVFTICISAACAFALVLSVGIGFASDQVSSAISGAPNVIITACLIVGLFANLLFRFLNVSARMEKKVVLYSVQTTLQAVVGKLLYIGVAIWSPTHQSAIIVMTLGYFVVTMVFLMVQFRDNFTRQVDCSRQVMGTLFRFGLPLVPVSLLSWLNNSLASLLLKAFVSYSAIGIYTNAVGVASVINVLQSGFNTYWTPFVYENYQNNGQKLRRMHELITFAMAAFGLLLVLAQDIIYLLIGGDFRASKEFFPFLLLSPICYTIAETTGLGINLSKKSYLNVVTFVANTAVNLLLCLWLLPYLGVVGAAIAAAVSAVVMLVVKTILGERYYKCITSYSKTFSAVLLIALAAVCNWLFFSIVWLKYICFVVLLALLVWIFRNEAAYLFRFAVSLLRDIFRRFRHKSASYR